jgi:hypothetical protein
VVVEICEVVALPVFEVVIYELDDTDKTSELNGEVKERIVLLSLINCKCINIINEGLIDKARRLLLLVTLCLVIF